MRPDLHRAFDACRSVLKRLATDLLVTLLDDACAGCDGDLSRPTGPCCKRCERTLDSPANHDDPSRARPPAGGIAVEAPHVHAGVPRRLVHALKYRGRRDVAIVLAHSMLVDEGVARALARADVIVPVPADPLRRRERGFDQARLLAVELSQASNRPPGRRRPVVAALRRRPSARPQAALPAAARRRAVARLMRPAPLARRAVAGRHVVLVDDVVTTGATAREAERVLRLLGAASVTLVACTRTVAPGASRSVAPGAIGSAAGGPPP